MKEKKDFFRILNINNYSELSKEKLSNPIKFFIIITIIFSLISFVSVIPNMINFFENYEKNINNLEDFEIKINISTNNPITISEEPYIKIDSKASNNTQKGIIITKDKVYKNSLFFSNEFDISSFDIKDFLTKHKNKLIALTAILFPFILVFIIIATLIKNILMVLFFSSIAFLILKILDLEIRYKDIFSVFLYSIFILFVLDILVSYINKIYFFVPLIGYLIWTTIALILLKDSKFEFEHNENVVIKKKKKKDENLDKKEINKINNMLKK